MFVGARTSPPGATTCDIPDGVESGDLLFCVISYEYLPYIGGPTFLVVDAGLNEWDPLASPSDISTEYHYDNINLGTLFFGAHVELRVVDGTEGAYVTMEMTLTTAGGATHPTPDVGSMVLAYRDAEVPTGGFDFVADQRLKDEYDASPMTITLTEDTNTYNARQQVGYLYIADARGNDSVVTPDPELHIRARTYTPSFVKHLVWADEWVSVGSPYPERSVTLSNVGDQRFGAFGRLTRVSSEEEVQLDLVLPRAEKVSGNELPYQLHTRML